MDSESTPAKEGRSRDVLVQGRDSLNSEDRIGRLAKEDGQRQNYELKKTSLLRLRPVMTRCRMRRQGCFKVDLPPESSIDVRFALRELSC